MSKQAIVCTCNVGPGKFEGEGALTFMAWEQVLLGNVDESVGRYDFMKAPYNFDADASVVEAAQAYGYCEACIEDYDDGSYGLVVSESDQGFVDCTTYSSREEYEAAIAEAEAEDSEDSDE